MSNNVAPIQQSGLHVLICLNWATSRKCMQYRLHACILTSHIGHQRDTARRSTKSAPSSHRQVWRHSGDLSWGLPLTFPPHTRNAIWFRVSNGSQGHISARARTTRDASEQLSASTDGNCVKDSLQQSPSDGILEQFSTTSRRIWTYSYFFDIRLCIRQSLLKETHARINSDSIILALNVWLSNVWILRIWY